MNVYLVKFNVCHYEQYKSFVVIAESGERAIEMLKEKYKPDDYYNEIEWKEGYTVEEVSNDKEDIILGNFREG